MSFLSSTQGEMIIKWCKMVTLVFWKKNFRQDVTSDVWLTTTCLHKWKEAILVQICIVVKSKWSRLVLQLCNLETFRWPGQLWMPAMAEAIKLYKKKCCHNLRIVQLSFRLLLFPFFPAVPLCLSPSVGVSADVESRLLGSRLVQLHSIKSFPAVYLPQDSQ